MTTTEKPKFSKHFNTEYNRFQRVKSQFANLFSMTVSFKSSQQEYCDNRRRIYESTDYLKLNQGYRQYMHGMQEEFMKRLDWHVYGQEPLLESLIWFEGDWRDKKWVVEQAKTGREIHRELCELNPICGFFWKGTDRPGDRHWFVSVEDKTQEHNYRSLTREEVAAISAK